MGCDIHFFAEYRDDENSPWKFLPAPGDGYDYKERDRIQAKGGKYECAHPYRYGVTSSECPPGYDDRWRSPEDTKPLSLRDWFDDRNYRLFGMLANVRNYGEVTPILGEEVIGKSEGPYGPEAIAHTRGWPDDCCEELEREREMIEHTPSWLTVREMLDHFKQLPPEETPNRFEACLQEMIEVAGVSPENIRAVFYFDN